MDGGTYARALKVGFPEKQAAFFAHLGMETKQEAVDYMEQKRIEREKWENDVRRRQDRFARRAFYGFVLFVLGTLAGVGVSAAGWVQ